MVGPKVKASAMPESAGVSGTSISEPSAAMRRRRPPAGRPLGSCMASITVWAGQEVKVSIAD